MGNTHGQEDINVTPNIDSDEYKDMINEDEILGIGYKNTIISSNTNDYKNERNEMNMNETNFDQTNSETTNPESYVLNALCDFFDIEEINRPGFKEILNRKRVVVESDKFTNGTVLLDGAKELNTSHNTFYIIHTGQINVVDMNNGSSTNFSTGQYVNIVDKDLRSLDIIVNVIEDSTLWYISHGDMIKIQYIYNLYRKSVGSDSGEDTKTSSTTPKRSSIPSHSSSSSTLSQLRSVSSGCVYKGDGIVNHISRCNDKRVTFNPTVQVILMATKEEYVAWGVKSDVWYGEKDYTRFRSERAVAATLGENDIFFGARGVMVSSVDGTPVTSVYGKHELDDTLSKAYRE